MATECGGKEQSPINIVTHKAEVDWGLKEFEFVNYEVKQAKNWTITNNGHTVQVNLDESAKISSGGLSGTYRAVQLHFHWGQGTSDGKALEPGSEHSIDGERFAMELHIVHIKDDSPNITEALSNNGVAVLGFFIATGDKNENYTPLISKLTDVTNPGDTDWMSPLPLSSLIPQTNLSKYYRYNGSLTTPKCNENITWTVFMQPVSLSLTQVQEFWKNLHFSANSTMVDNFRPVQPLGDRKVYRSDSTALVSPGKILLVLPVAIHLLLSLTQ